MEAGVAPRAASAQMDEGGLQATMRLPVAGRLIFNDALTYLETCLTGVGVAQVLDLGIEPALAEGRLIELFPCYPDECWGSVRKRKKLYAKLARLGF